MTLCFVESSKFSIATLHPIQCSEMHSNIVFNCVLQTLNGHPIFYTAYADAQLHIVVRFTVTLCLIVSSKLLMATLHCIQCNEMHSDIVFGCDLQTVTSHLSKT